MNRNLHIILGSILLIIIVVFIWKGQVKPAPTQQVNINSYEECVAAGNPVMESYPEQCAANGQTFTREIGNELEKNDLIRITSPRPGQTVRSPITVTGEARGGWYFEATFPVVVTNWDGLIIGEGYAEAQGEWMTNDFVPFEATVTYQNATSTYSNKGYLILQKSNASGLPGHDDSLEIPVMLQ